MAWTKDRFDANKDGKVDIKDLSHVTKRSGKKVKSEIKKNVMTAVLAAFGFIIALVWRDAIREIVDEVIKRVGIEGTGYFFTIITAVLVTIVCVVGILFFSKLKGQEDVKK